MPKRIVLGFVCIAIAAGVALASRASELYIPIGRSPGLSDSLTVSGTIHYVDYAAGTMTVTTPAGRREVRIADTTRIYLDFSTRRKSNTYGTMDDCRPGEFVEIKLGDGESGHADIAEWVKIRR